jgi:hypothetical protein
MQLPDYIKKIGVPAFAQKFNVSQRAAISWMYRTRMPRPDVAQRIVTGSPVTWEGIYRSERRT